MHTIEGSHSKAAPKIMATLHMYSKLWDMCRYVCDPFRAGFCGMFLIPKVPTYVGERCADANAKTSKNFYNLLISNTFVIYRTKLAKPCIFCFSNATHLYSQIDFQPAVGKRCVMSRRRTLILASYLWVQDSSRWADWNSREGSKFEEARASENSKCSNFGEPIFCSSAMRILVDLMS